MFDIGRIDDNDPIGKRAGAGFEQIEQMEAEGIIGPATEGSKPREVIDYGEDTPDGSGAS